MAFGLIIIGLLLILPGNYCLNGNTNEKDEEYQNLLNRLRLIAERRENEIFEQQYRDYKQKERYSVPDPDGWREVLDDEKRFQSIEKDALDSGNDVELPVDTNNNEETTSTEPKSTKASHVHPSPPQPLVANENNKSNSIGGFEKYDLLFIGIVAACSLAGFIGLIMAGVCWYKLNKNIKAASEVDYPAYGVTGPTKERLGSGPGDRKLAQSAQMYHYQHQKQQMIAMEKANGEMKHDASEDESEEENEEGDYTVYECPGLAPTGEMEVRNPLFNEETPVSHDPPEEHKDAQ